ncbi:Alpha/Beta hydrolase protein [Cladochytrium replicatum]|nr:Alpha/Beta hydrolase protein [Cladochytrium replicatum]
MATKTKTALTPSAGARDFNAVLPGNFHISGKVWGRSPQETTDPAKRFLCLHGWLDNSNTWDRSIPKLIVGYEDASFLALDFAGHGWSDHRTEAEEYMLHRYVYDVLQIAEQVGWDRFGIIGHSMGGGVGLIIAGTFPERVTSLISVDIFGPYSVPANQQPDVLQRAWADRLEFPTRNPKPLYKVPSEAALARARSGEVSLEVARILTDRGAYKVPGDDRERWTWRSDQRLRATFPGWYTNETVLEIIRRIEAPVLVVLAPTRTGRGDIIEGRLKELGDKGTVVRFANAKHHLHMEPESAGQFVDVVRKFLAEKVWAGKAKL